MRAAFGIMILMTLCGIAFAEEGASRRIVIYGECCGSPYGICKKQLEVSEAIETVQLYFKERGYDIDVVDVRGRFMRIIVFKNGRPADVVIMDRKTGRIRSIY